MLLFLLTLILSSQAQCIITDISQILMWNPWLWIFYR